ncbi:hypothetical protein BXT86_05075 [candidate division WOR-3 bacterium 4484_100]|uniref:Uncharacterized protein n=1 Tax=candidate division WOR-3 bacterium 4484_100 TaxID=1936077 RepID=A0A1V4QFQ0_UNCW3|nr:MAG: hypothetical protein BXT86_05075 [candidate division WOR-3 bacterium 4484_100]
MRKFTNALLAGLGLAARVRKRFLYIFDELVKEGESVRTQSEFLKHHWTKVNKAQDRFDELCTRIAERANLVTRSQFEQLNKKIDKLLKQKRSG